MAPQALPSPSGLGSSLPQPLVPSLFSKAWLGGGGGLSIGLKGGAAAASVAAASFSFTFVLELAT